jgi:hypothetical protein
MNANERVLITYKPYEGRPTTLSLSLEQIDIVSLKERYTLSWVGAPLPWRGLFEYVIIEVTNDPTPRAAGGVISLGYYVCRITMSNVSITTGGANVLTTGVFSARISRPGRIPHDFMHEEGTRSVISPIIFSKGSFRYTLLFGTPHDNYWWLVETDYDKETTVVKGINPNSLFHPIKLLPPSRRKVSESVVLHHENILAGLLEDY